MFVLPKDYGNSGGGVPPNFSVPPPNFQNGPGGYQNQPQQQQQQQHGYPPQHQQQNSWGPRSDNSSGGGGGGGGGSYGNKGGYGGRDNNRPSYNNPRKCSLMMLFLKIKKLLFSYKRIRFSSLFFAGNDFNSERKNNFR